MDQSTFFSFGGGVQSSALALMLATNPEVFDNLGYPLPMHIIFADTGAETEHVLKNVDNIFGILEEAGYKTYVVKAKDSILDEVLGSSGRGISTPPYYTKDSNGKVGILRRQCTRVYKIDPIIAKQREILGYKYKQRIPSGKANLWLGISVEEARRMKASANCWITNRYPLVDLRLDRSACGAYAYKVLGYSVKKSSCFFCPFKHQEEWVSLKRDNPDLFDKAVEFDERIRNLTTFGKVNNPCYIHRSGLPLKDAAGVGIQLSLFNQPEEECSGTCFL